MVKTKQTNPNRNSSGRRPQHHLSPLQRRRPYPPTPRPSRVRKPPRTNPPPSQKSLRRPMSHDPPPTTSHGSRAGALPFSPHQPILLIGEGDFSFALGLHATHHCLALTATTLLSTDELAATHRAGPANAALIAEAGHTVLHGIDATALGKPGVPNGAALRRKRFATIIFNFPHIGGKSTDIARQARANQELLRAFFEGAKRLLTDQWGGRVVISLWEGAVYDAWGLKALARESGLGVERSEAFDWEFWKGYRHVRNSGKDIVDNGKAWSGERRARMWIFRRQEELTEAAKHRSRTSDTEDASDE